MDPSHEQSMSYADRLSTFDGYWDDAQATARQLAAVGHVYDRPPLEALEEGSRCISCSAFLSRHDSIRVLQGPFSRFSEDQSPSVSHTLHHPECIRLQIRIPLGMRKAPPRLGANASYKLQSKKRRNGHLPSGPRAQTTGRLPQSSPFFSLPTELRIQIYSYVLPSLSQTQHMTFSSGNSGRIATLEACVGGVQDRTKVHILSTCQAIHDEALDFLLSAVTYRFESTTLLYLFLRHIGSRGRKHLKSVDVVCGLREDAIAFALLGSCEALQKIVLRLTRPKLLLPRAPIWSVDGVACLLELRGLQSVEIRKCKPGSPYLRGSSHDAELLRKEVMRPRGEKGGVRWIIGTLDI